ncbi:DUF3305 domain-containing protein [Novispirillum sp. DQ9]|uniref:DUF3305 domain-containing protein n=1 Tax=Novispirillum sp. DQ9 TaxID=3398612 RepID=UPI003C7E610E
MIETLPVWVVAERRVLAGPWPTTRWTVTAVGPGTADMAPGTVLERGDGWERLYMGTAPLRLYAGETANYLHALRAERPTLAVILRRAEGDGMRLLTVTVDPGEVDVHADSGDDLIEAVPLPRAIGAWVRNFVAAHHVDRPVWRRRRDSADPDALGRRPKVGS